MDMANSDTTLHWKVSINIVIFPKTAFQLVVKTDVKSTKKKKCTT
jgi:hypothetical protein